ncbi:MAG: TetR/AcrR family transcriptional regulator [Hydrogenophaga sp.]|nr:TetR/AcrR family transcriptional regulator [Hydrogenophaga sp.]
MEVTKQKRPRKRHGNTADHQAVQQEILDAAFSITRKNGGVQALSMRGLAAELGLSAMGIYRYFDSKAAVLHAMWQYILIEATAATSGASSQGSTARERLRAGIEAFLIYWETHPEHFKLVFMTEEILQPSGVSSYTSLPAYSDAVKVGHCLTEAFIAEVGGDPKCLLAARDLRMALMVGYLHARLVNQRFPWHDHAVLRSNTIEAILLGMEACVTKPTSGLTTSAPTAAKKSGRRGGSTVKSPTAKRSVTKKANAAHT